MGEEDLSKPLMFFDSHYAYIHIVSAIIEESGEGETRVRR